MDICPSVDIVLVAGGLHQLKVRVAVFKPLPLRSALDGLLDVCYVVHVQLPVKLRALRDGQVPALVPALEEMLVLGDVVRKAGHAGFVELQPLAVGVSQPPHLLDGVAV